MKKRLKLIPLIASAFLLFGCNGGPTSQGSEPVKSSENPSTSSVTSESKPAETSSAPQETSEPASTEGSKTGDFTKASGESSEAPVESSEAPVESSEAPISQESEEPQSSEETSKEFIDYVHNGNVKLNLEYSGHTFATDGIEQVSLKTAIDGDTAHFTPKSGGETIKARFYGIDTPESTGKIQDYGIPASNYTKEKLKAADKNGTIVVSSAQADYGTPNPDSTGSRYVSLIWINLEKKNAPISELYCLNLAIVQDGYSWVKNVADMPDYVDTFYAAEAQAKEWKLNLFSGVPDETIPHGEYEMVSLLDLKREIVASIKDPNHENAFDKKKVRLQGTVAGYSNHILFLQDYFPAQDEEGREIEGEGEYAGVNIFCGMSAISEDYTTRGNYIQVCGYALESENFGFQISGCTFLDFPMRDTDAQVIYYADENDDHPLYTKEYTCNGLSSAITDGSYDFLYCSVKITDTFKVTSGYTSDDNAVTLKFGQKWQVYLTAVYSPTEGTYWRSHEDFVGKTFRVQGVLTVHKTASGYYQYQIVPSKNADLVLVTE